jgi:hypothetical protein
VSFGQGSFADDDTFGQESSLADESFVGRSLERCGEQDKDFMHFSFNNLASLLQRNLELAGEATAKAKIGDTQRGTQLHPQRRARALSQSRVELALQSLWLRSVRRCWCSHYIFWRSAS